MDWFENWFGSPYYHILYQDRDEQEAQEFVEKLLAYLKPNAGSTMLDIACGEGRFARQLAGHGFNVTGIDISDASIQKASALENDNLNFYVQDMRQPFYINYFDYAFNFFTSFGYFDNDRDHELAARAFATALKKEGILVIDYLNAGYVAANLNPEDTIQKGDFTFSISRKQENNHFIKDIRFKDADNKDRHFTESVAAFSVADFQRMLKPSGMSLIATFGDYLLNPYHPVDMPRLIMVFKKNNA